MRRSTRDRGLLFLGFSLALGARALAQEPEDRPTLELTVDDVVKRALDNNSDIAVAKYNPESSLESVRSAQGYYDPFASASLSKNKATTPGSNAFTGGNKVSNTTDTWNFGVSQYAPKFQVSVRSEEHTSELQSHSDLVCRLLLEKKKKKRSTTRQWRRLTHRHQ